MEASLDDEKDRGYDLDTNSLRVTFPLLECLRDLKENFKVVKDGQLEQIVRTGDKIAGEEVAGLLAAEIKKKLFWGVVQDARVNSASQHAIKATAGSAAVVS